MSGHRGSVRPLEGDDLPQLLALYPFLNPDDPALPPDRAREIWALQQAQAGLLHFGAFAADSLVAACTLSVIPNLTRGGRPYALIENVVTHVDHRRQGWGRAVLTAAIAHAWTAGCYKVMLATGRTDPGVHRFYRRVGFDADAKQAFVLRAP